MFGNEQYSREAFEDAQKREQDAKDIALEGNGDLIEPARKKLDELMKSGHKEALQLNKEYEKLYDHSGRLGSEATQAGYAYENSLRDLERFEREKLGMNVPEREKGIHLQLRWEKD